MSTLRYFGICVVVLAGSFAGSFAVHRGTPAVHAQAPGASDIRARSFTVVDAQGRTVARLRATDSGAEMELSGRQMARVEISGAGSISIHNAAGRLIWSAPAAGIMPASE